MKKIILVSLLIPVFTLQVFSQHKRHENFDYEKFKAEKIAFITEAIELTPAEAETFWPVYNEFEKKKWELISGRHDLEKDLQENIGELTSQEYKELSIRLASFPVEDGKLNIEYNTKFLELLSSKKVVQLYIAEVNFRGKLLRKYRESEKKEN